MMLEIALDADSEWDSSTDWVALARAAATSAIAESAFPQLADGARSAELSVRLTTNEEIRGLNAKWRGKDRPTNVLSFPMADHSELEASPRQAAFGQGPGLMLGDLVLAHGTCAAEAAAKAISIEDHAAHLLVHGTLHLLGDDHHDDQAAATMEQREIRALARLGIADPYSPKANEDAV